MSKQTIYFMPTTEMGRNMLISIPKKVRAWLESMGELKKPFRGRHGHLEWNIQNTQTKLSHIMLDGEEPFMLCWEGTWTNMYTPRGTEEWLRELEFNLDKFVALEKRVYDELEEMQREVDERNLQALQTN